MLYQVFGLILSFLTNFGVFWMGSLCKNIQILMKLLKAPQSSFLGPTFFLLYSNEVPDYVISNDTTLYSNCNQVTDLWHQLELVSELESGL